MLREGEYLRASSKGEILLSDWAQSLETVILIDINGGYLVDKDLVHLRGAYKEFFVTDPDESAILWLLSLDHTC